MPDGSQDRTRKGRKYDQVLAGAREVFLAAGFDGASVDDIARAAEVSKATLYSYFPDKRILFLEVARVECLRQADTVLATIDREAPVALVLTHIGHQIVEFITSAFGQQIFRICVAEAARFPEVGREFYDSGPMLACRELSAVFEEAIARGELRIDDLHLAAHQFQELCKADIFPKLVFGIAETFTEAEKARVVDGAVATFLARYGTAQAR